MQHTKNKIVKDSICFLQNLTKYSNTVAINYLVAIYILIFVYKLLSPKNNDCGNKAMNIIHQLFINMGDKIKLVYNPKIIINNKIGKYVYKSNYNVKFSQFEKEYLIKILIIVGQQLECSLTQEQADKLMLEALDTTLIKFLLSNYHKCIIEILKLIKKTSSRKNERFKRA